MEEQSILKSTKKLLGLSDDFKAFDLDVLVNINAALATLAQITNGVFVPLEDENTVWGDLSVKDLTVLNMAKQYIYLRTRLAFDPPNTSFVLTAIKEQIKEHEWRIEVEASKPIAIILETP